MALPLSSQGKIADPFRFTTFYVSFALLLFALILSCFREKPPFFSPKNVNPVSFPWKLDGSGVPQPTPQPSPYQQPLSLLVPSIPMSSAQLGLGAGRNKGSRSLCSALRGFFLSYPLIF